MFKFLKLYRFFVPTLHFINFGGSSGSSTTTPVLTPEQADLLKYQTEQLKTVFMPQYTQAVQGAQQNYNMLQPYANTAALNAFNTFGDTSKSAMTGATNAYTSGINAVSYTHLTLPTNREV